MDKFHVFYLPSPRVTKALQMGCPLLLSSFKTPWNTSLGFWRRMIEMRVGGGAEEIFPMLCTTYWPTALEKHVLLEAISDGPSSLWEPLSWLFLLPIFPAVNISYCCFTSFPLCSCLSVQSPAFGSTNMTCHVFVNFPAHMSAKEVQYTITILNCFFST